MKLIQITAIFEVTFVHKVSNSEFSDLESGANIASVVDESVAYRLASTDGTCEMEWEYTPSSAPKLKKKKSDRRRAE